MSQLGDVATISSVSGLCPALSSICLLSLIIYLLFQFPQVLAPPTDAVYWRQFTQLLTAPEVRFRGQTLRSTTIPGLFFNDQNVNSLAGRGSAYVAQQLQVRIFFLTLCTSPLFLGLWSGFDCCSPPDNGR